MIVSQKHSGSLELGFANQEQYPKRDATEEVCWQRKEKTRKGFDTFPRILSSNVSFYFKIWVSFSNLVD